MHIFLTGEIQVGKTTAITRALSLLGAPYGGFCTYFGPDRLAREHFLYIQDASLPKRFDLEHAVARFSEGLPPVVFPDRFDELGARFISEAEKRASLVVMDELGNLEDGAPLFKARVLSALDGDIPVLGVVKKSAGGWVDKVRSHPAVSLIEVDRHNRDDLPHMLAERLRPLLKAEVARPLRPDTFKIQNHPQNGKNRAAGSCQAGKTRVEC